MFLIIFSILSACLVIAKVIYGQMNTMYFDTMNNELTLYYTMDSSNKQTKFRQLSKAAAFTINGLRELKNKIEEVNRLVEERLISNKYLSNLLDLQKEFILERVIVKNEAESLVPGSSDQLFEEATRMKNGCVESKKLNLVDAKLYLKKRDMFFNNFQKITDK